MAALTSSHTTNSLTASTSAHSRSRTPTLKRKQSSQGRTLRKPSLASAASTPNLNSAYAQTGAKTRAGGGLGRKTSLATLSLAPVPDVPQHFLNGGGYIYNDENSTAAMPPATPGRLAAPGGGDVTVGDIVDVPGNMQGTVKFVGSVQGKAGRFAGVELHEDFAARGKNSGDVEGVSYFTTSIPGAGIFLPVAKAIRAGTGSPGRPSLGGSIPATPTTSGLRMGSQNSTNFTPPTPALPKFSQSVGPGARAPSPQGKRGPRSSLARPESPVRRTPVTPGKPTIATPAKTPGRYGSPTNRFAQSVRGTSGDPAKTRSRLERKQSIGPRSASALGNNTDDEMRPPPNGSFAKSVASYSTMMRPPSRANTANNTNNNAANEEELERLRAQLEERDRQFKEQAANLNEMEASLTELQALMESSEGPVQKSELDDHSTQELKAIIREKNEKIGLLTAEFDNHRADFRSTIDTLELASTETERVYEKRIEELIAEVRELESRNMDVDSVASQLKQLEELVQELEEGLEDARRGEAEARGEVEFLRGEVERTRTELRREKEKIGSPTGMGGDQASQKELEAKQDEIRGLKAIIHSLSRDSIPNTEASTPTQGRQSFLSNEAVNNKIARDNLERQVAELQSMLDNKISREEELEHELENLRNDNSGSSQQRNGHRSSLRDSRDTVVLARAAQGARSPDSGPSAHKRVNSLLDTMPESDTYSTATENSTLWCEICEAAGHDILTCTNMFGSEAAKTNGELRSANEGGVTSAPKLDTHHEDRRAAHDDGDEVQPLKPLSPAKKEARPSSPIRILPNPMDSGPVAGKESGVIDAGKWCAVCERDGHDSVDCPFEDAF